MITKVRKLLKAFLPKTLFWRSLIIIITPVLLLQIISIYIFVDRHWSKITDRLAYAVAGEVSVIASSIESNPDPQTINRIAKYTAQYLDLLISFKQGETLQPVQAYRGPWHALVADPLEDQLDRALHRPYTLQVGQEQKKVEISIQLRQGVLHVVCLERRLFSSTTYIFLIWMVSASIVLFAIAILFMRNQIRPIHRLAIAAVRFGKGRDVSNFKPEGASEVRQAGRAFQDMRDRIRRQIDQRTTMLAGVSHDLKTPLTRIKLGLSMLPESADTIALRSDVVQMEKMLEGYLSFTRGAGQEQTQSIAIKAFVLDAIESAKRSGLNLKAMHIEDIFVPIKPIAIQRCLENIFENARKYASRAEISIQIDEEGTDALFYIDDDGPGIEEAFYDEVFKPFSRLEPSRNPQTGGVGLGLPIALDIVHSHGGALTLHKSPIGGLRVMIRLPL